MGRIALTPFECAMGALLSLVGLSAILKWGPADPVNGILPHWEVLVLSLVFIVSGMATNTGIVTSNIAIEAFGLYLMCGSLICRLILFELYFGPNTTFILSGALDTVFCGASILRILLIRKHNVVIQIRKDGSAQLDITAGPSDPSGQ